MMDILESVRAGAASAAKMSQKMSQDEISAAQTLLDQEFDQYEKAYPVPEFSPSPTCIPGIGDVFVRHVSRLGYKGNYPRSYDWENLIPQLQSGEELLWIIRKRGSSQEQTLEWTTGLVREYAFEVYLGLKFNGECPTSKEEWENRGRRFAALTRHFAKSAFPETKLECPASDFETANFLKEIVDFQHVRIVAGMPSIKDVDLRDVAAKRDDGVMPYSGLNDFLEMHGGARDNFAVIFSVTKAEPGWIQSKFNQLFEIRNTIKPLVETIVQYSIGLGTSEGSDDQIKGGEGGRQVKKRGWIPRLGRAFTNLCRSACGIEEKGDNYKYEKTIGVQLHHTKTENAGANWSEKTVNSKLEFMDERIKEFLAQLTQTMGTGGYCCGAAIYSDESFVADSIANAACATMSGGHSALFPMRAHRMQCQLNHDWLMRKKSLAQVIEEDGVQGGILNCEKACLFLPVPVTHMVGLPLKKNVFYGKEKSENCDDGEVSVGAMSFSESHVSNEQTKGFFGQDDHLQVKLGEEDFFSHLFVVGTTGCGKTTRAARLLHDASRFRKIILETAKKTYWKELGLRPEEVLIYTLGDSTRHPLRFNPFYFEEGTNLKQHIAVLSDAISDLLPMEALIGPKLREAVERSYQVCGWDIETSAHAPGEIRYPDVALFNLMVYQVAEEMSDYGPEVRGNYKGALLNRAGIFMDAVYQDIFAFDGNKTIDELFPADKTVIIEMEEMPPSEINMPAFIVSLLLQRIRSYQNQASNKGTLKRSPGFLIAIEEAHNVLSKGIQEKGDESQSGHGGHLVRQVTRLLAEGRGLKMGMMIIDQSSANIAPQVITNSNTKMVFRQEDGLEIETIGRAIGLTDSEWGDLQLLERGEYLLRNGRYPQPVKMAPLAKIDMLCNDGVRRDDYVRKLALKEIPRYQEAETLLREYCTRIDGGVKQTKDGNVFVGFKGESYRILEKKLLEALCRNSELLRYCKVKAAIAAKYYLAAHLEYGIVYLGSANVT